MMGIFFLIICKYFETYNYLTTLAIII